MRKKTASALAVLLAMMAPASQAGAQESGERPSDGGRGTFVDTRDGQEYRWVSVAGRWWMAENLDFATQSGWWYYENDSIKHRSGLGRLYTWEAAQAACPPAWHLPSQEEWKGLISQAGGVDLAGDWLKSPDAFNAPLAGLRRYEGSGSFVGLGEEGNYWTADPHYEDHAKYLAFYRDRSQVQFFGYHRDAGNSVRCVKSGGSPGAG